MRIFSNFDTELDERLYKEYSERYWKENVHVVFRAQIFLLLTIIFPSLLFIFLFLVAAILLYYMDLWDWLNITKWAFYFILFFVSFIIFGWKMLKNFIDYKMDFAIIAPWEIVAYNQIGIFSRAARTLDVDKLKTISVDKRWILNSFFNYWDINFLSEWDESWDGDINFKFVYDPDDVKLRIKEIIWTYSNYDQSWRSSSETKSKKI